jgi:hypothetical protein
LQHWAAHLAGAVATQDATQQVIITHLIQAQGGRHGQELQAQALAGGLAGLVLCGLECGVIEDLDGQAALRQAVGGDVDLRGSSKADNDKPG